MEKTPREKRNSLLTGCHPACSPYWLHHSRQEMFQSGQKDPTHPDKHGSPLHRGSQAAQVFWGEKKLPNSPTALGRDGEPLLPTNLQRRKICCKFMSRWLLLTLWRRCKAVFLVNLVSKELTRAASRDAFQFPNIKVLIFIS